MSTIGSLFSGALGLDRAVMEMFGADLAWTSDIKPAAVKLIDHYHPGSNLGDITTIDWSQVEPVDIMTGGSPCQDMSMAGGRAGMNSGTRSGLWSYMRDAIETIRPRFVVWENVRGALSAAADSDLEPCPWCLGDGPTCGLRALGRVLGDLVDCGYDAQWVGLRASDVGAPHGRFRIFLLATDTRSHEPQRRGGRRDVGGAAPQNEGTGGQRQRVRHATVDRGAVAADAIGGGWDGWAPEPIGSSLERTAPARSGEGDRTSADADGRGCKVSEEFDRDPTQDPAHWSACREHTDGHPGANWGQYASAIERWERILGRPAPHPTITGPKGGQALSPDLTDWMMGWPAGWTDIPGLSRAQRLSLGGDGVVPAQAVAALSWLLQQIPAVVAS